MRRTPVSALLTVICSSALGLAVACSGGEPAPEAKSSQDEASAAAVGGAGGRAHDEVEPTAPQPEVDHCDDGSLSGNESDVDCGGRCAPCDDGELCNGGSDCKSRVCEHLVDSSSPIGGAGGVAGGPSVIDPGPEVCIPARCGDDVVNGAEECDDGNAKTEECEYGKQSCTVCDAKCSEADGSAHYCGDRTLDAGEHCDTAYEDCTNSCEWDESSVCQRVAGLTWCYNPGACGQSCEDVCAAFDKQPIESSETWFQAQNEAAECQALADAFGFQEAVLGNGQHDCLQDTFGPHSAPGRLNTKKLFCSTNSDCPDHHRTAADQLGVTCSTNTDLTRRSICPCE